MTNLAHGLCRNTGFWTNAEWWQAIVGIFGILGTLLLAYIAIVGKEKFRKLKFEYELSKIDQKVNNETFQIFRIKIQNLGKRSAKGMLATVTEVYDKKNSKYHRRKDFIHMPLEWTHYPMDKKVRNIAAKEEVYVDIGQYDLFDPGLKLYTNPRTNSENLFLIMNDAKITLRITEEHGFTEEVKLNFKIQLTGGDMSIANTKILNKG